MLIDNNYEGHEITNKQMPVCSECPALRHKKRPSKKSICLPDLLIHNGNRDLAGFQFLQEGTLENCGGNLANLKRDIARLPSIPMQNEYVPNDCPRKEKFINASIDVYIPFTWRDDISINTNNSSELCGFCSFRAFPVGNICRLSEYKIAKHRPRIPVCRAEGSECEMCQQFNRLMGKSVCTLGQCLMQIGIEETKWMLNSKADLNYQCPNLEAFEKAGVLQGPKQLSLL